MAEPESTAAGYFGSMVEQYDSLIRRAVPRYDEMTDRLVEHLPWGPRRIVELGCGTGNLTLRLARGFPDAEILAVDAAPQMTDITARRAQELPAGAARVRTATARFEDFDAPPGSADLVTSCMSLHHVRDKSALYHAMAGWLQPGGTLAFADQLLGATDRAQKLHWNLWLDFCRQPGHCTPEEVASLLEHSSAHDHYVAWPEHEAMLAAAGFVDVDCVWRIGMYTVVTAQRRP
jgi:ubiquinone/menaquinone biosynthesis C-methylase UbiE